MDLNEKSMNTLWCKHRVNSVIIQMKKTKQRELFAQKFGEYVKKMRKSKDKTQESLAFESDIHSTYVGHIETGKYIPSIFVVSKIAKALKMSLPEFLKGFK